MCLSWEYLDGVSAFSESYGNPSIGPRLRGWIQIALVNDPSTEEASRLRWKNTDNIHINLTCGFISPLVRRRTVCYAENRQIPINRRRAAKAAGTYEERLGIRMQKVIVVSKTHLDLGFTDYAEEIRQKYLNEFIPNAVSIANELNADGIKRFVWTTGSWLIKEALENGSEQNRQALLQGLRSGNIAPHAMPFTTHTELLDADTLDYGLSIVDRIDAITGRKTIAAKMTDVPGHTIGLVPLLAKHGIKLLHIGVNGASALPDVPPCFLWKCGESEVVIIYSGDYGGAFASELTGSVLYFDHTLDNRGASGAEAVRARFEAIQKKYPGAQVAAGRLDDFAEMIWQAKDRLPVVTAEIGDTWIHGAASDPYKTAGLRTLIRLKNEWLADGRLAQTDAAYEQLADHLLCAAEHTWGLDMKTYFADYEHYLRPDFEQARRKDTVELRHPLRGFPQNLLTVFFRHTGTYRPGSYRAMEKSWEEQRAYLTHAVSKLPAALKSEAEQALAALQPQQLVPVSGAELQRNVDYHFKTWSIRVNEYGGIGALSCGADRVIRENNRPAVEYYSYGKTNYDFWLTHYTRNRKETASWSLGDFARPLLKYADSKYPQGRFPYRFRQGCVQALPNGLRICVYLSIAPECHDKLGAAETVQLIYTLYAGEMKIEVIWAGKPANRLTESTVFRLYPACAQEEIRYTKIDTEVDPMTVVKNGNRNLSAVWDMHFGPYRFINRHAALIGLGKGKILRFDNQFESIEQNGISYILHDNVWGTNFPLWYEDNAYFRFDIVPIKSRDPQ